MMKEQVNHPSHYQKNGKECIDEMIETYGIVATICFCIINEFKYNWRAGEKEGNSWSQDIGKGKWYLDFATKAYCNCTWFQKFRIKYFHRTVFKVIRDRLDKIEN